MHRNGKALPSHSVFLVKPDKLHIKINLHGIYLAYKNQLSANQGILALSLTSMSESARRSRASSSE